MRVLHISPSYAPAYRYGGPIQSLDGLLRSLRVLHVDARVITTDCDGENRLNVPTEWTEHKGVPVRYFHSVTDRDLSPKMWRGGVREVEDADLVHVTGLFCSTSMWGIAASTRANKPCILSPRGALEGGSLTQKPWRKRAWLSALRPLLSKVSAFHVTSEKEAEAVGRALGPNTKTLVVPNGVDADEYVRTARLGDSPHVVALGRVHPSKGYHRVLPALALLRDRGLRVDFRVAGPVEDLNYANALRDQATQLALNLELVGPLAGPAKIAFLQAGRLLVFPSLETENFGNVVIEALAASLPVVASRETPWPLLNRARCGDWVDATANSLADAMEPYLRNVDVAEAAGRRGRAVVEGDYTWTAVGRAMLLGYQGLISRVD